jgi:hypothetical protein
LAARCRAAVTAWRRDGTALPGPDGALWTPDDALALVEAMVSLFRAYNRVLWAQFPYCRQCRGGCCVVGASRVTAFDAIALALLGEEVPARPARLALAEGDCIYLTAQGCSWPAAWRPLKCATFYCLGSGAWELDASDARYLEITRALQEVVAPRLPGVLAAYEAEQGVALAETLFDPLAFARHVGEALYASFVQPFADHYPEAVALAETPQAVAIAGDEAQLAEIAALAAAAWEAPPDPPPGSDLSAAQLLADLELLEWVVLSGEAAAQQETLQRLAQRYAAAPPPRAGAIPSLWTRMRSQVAALLTGDPPAAEARRS